MHPFGMHPSCLYQQALCGCVIWTRGDVGQVFYLSVPMTDR